MADREMEKFAADLLQSVREAKRGEGIVTTPETIQARRGRPPSAEAKVAVKLRLDPDLVQVMRDSGAGWQTRANDALRLAMLGRRVTTTRAPAAKKASGPKARAAVKVVRPRVASKVG